MPIVPANRRHSRRTGGRLLVRSLAEVVLLSLVLLSAYGAVNAVVSRAAQAWAGPSGVHRPLRPEAPAPLRGGHPAANPPEAHGNAPVRLADASAAPGHQERPTRGTDEGGKSHVSAPPAPAAAAWDDDIDAHPPRGEFVRFFRMRATAYTPIATRMEGGRYTKTLRDGRSAHGVAVDPDLIPLGSKLWIPGYGHAVADDTGGWIQGHRVDVRVQDADNMMDWGHKRVRVYVLEEPADKP